MKKVILGLVWVLLTVFSSSAANVKGRVIDSKTKNAVDYATVSLLKKGVEAPMKATTTDLKGAFAIPGVPKGEYTLKVSFVGYTPVEVPVSVTEDGDINLKNIILHESVHALKEVQVVGQRTQMKLDVDRKVFSVDQNIASAGGSASEVLQNIPSVDVDNEGNVSLRNNSSVEVWINGRAAGLTEDNRAQILEQMPAESIERIEVITNPSAQYSPEGSAGIINIVLKKERKAGYYGSVSAGANTFGGVNGSINVNYNSAKVDAYANVGVRSMRFKNRTDTYRESWLDNPDDKSILNQKNRGKMNGVGTFIRTGVTWHMTENDDLGFSFMGMLGNRSNKTTLQSFDGAGILARDRISNSDGDHNRYDFTIDYNHKFNKTDNLAASVSYDFGVMKETSDYTQNTLQGVSAQQQKSNNDDKGVEIKVDYSKSIGEKFKLGAGYQGNLDWRTSDVRTFDGESLDILQPNIKLNNTFDYKENIQAIYATFSGKIDKFNFQAGLRGEYMRYNTKTEAYIPVDEGKKEYWHVYPSLFLGYSLPRGNELQVNYTSRVRRPRGWQINPFRNVTDSTSISYGNPNLDPEFTNAFELNYIKNWTEHTLSASLYYRNTDGVIQNVKYFDDPAMYSTFENITRSQSSGLELVSKNRLFRILDLTTTVNVYYYKLNGFDYSYRTEEGFFTEHYKGSEDFSWNARMMANVILPWSISLQVTGNYNSKRVSAQGETKDNYSLDAGIRKSFLSRKLNIAISGRDLLDSRRRKSSSYGSNFYEVSDARWGGRSVTFTLTYMFGNGGNKQKQRPLETPDSYENDMMDF